MGSVGSRCPHVPGSSRPAGCRAPRGGPGARKPLPGVALSGSRSPLGSKGHHPLAGCGHPGLDLPPGRPPPCLPATALPQRARSSLWIHGTPWHKWV